MKTGIIRYVGQIIILVLSGYGFAQSVENEKTWIHQVNISDRSLQQSITPEKNALFLKQLGIENQILLIQSAANYNNISQQGSSNLILQEQSIRSGRVQLEQNGKENHYRGSASGVDIDISVTQDGSLNTIDQYIVGQNLVLKIRQAGNGNAVYHQAEIARTPLEIHQSGNDMRLIIRSKN